MSSLDTVSGKNGTGNIGTG